MEKKNTIPFYKVGDKTVVLDRDLASALKTQAKRIRERIKEHVDVFPKDSLFWVDQKGVLSDAQNGILTSAAPALRAKMPALRAFGNGQKQGGKRDKNYSLALTYDALKILSMYSRKPETKAFYQNIIEELYPDENQNELAPVYSDTFNANIESKIFTIRDQFVILDEDLAAYYHSTVKRVNQQVNRNPLKFPKGFVFQLNQQEYESILKLQNVTSSWGGKRKLPYAFTEAGVYMLMTVLDSEIAAKQSVALILAFKEMKDRLYRNQYPLISVHEFDELKTKVWENDQTLIQLNKEVEDIKDRLDDPNAIKYFIIHNGERVLADEIFQKIYSRAKVSICIIDDYIGLRTLEHLRFCPHGIRITFISDNASQPKLTQSQVNDFQRDRPDLKLIFLRSKRLVHDRLIAIDMEDDFVLYHCGGSSKDAGEKITFIQELPMPERYKEVIEKLLDNEPLQMD